VQVRELIFQVLYIIELFPILAKGKQNRDRYLRMYRLAPVVLVALHREIRAAIRRYKFNVSPIGRILGRINALYQIEQRGVDKTPCVG